MRTESGMYLQPAEAFQRHPFPRALESVGGIGTLLFMAAHIPLALIMREVHLVTTIHAYATFAVALIIVLASNRIDRVIYVAAYITGSEVLWRMARADILWEFSKYSIVLIFFCAAIRSGRIRGSILSIFYFALLLPSLLIVFEKSQWKSLQGDLSFNLSGPLALAVCVFFFSQTRMTRNQMHRVFLTIIGPVIGVFTICAFMTMTRNIEWGLESNLAASGGFGPNQVSAVLGLGALLGFIFLLDSQASRAFKSMIFVIMVFLLIQAALTFSRSGLYMAVGGAIIVAVYLVRDGRTRLKLMFIGGLLFLIGSFVVLPRLGTFTGGALQERFESTDLTGRDALMRADVEIWKDNFLLGVGPGQTLYYSREGKHLAAHTEFSRLLAEHGIFGLMAIFLMMMIALQSLRKAKGAPERAIAGAFIAWTFLYMLVNAMRLVVPSFLFGLSCVYLLHDDSRA